MKRRAIIVGTGGISRAHGTAYADPEIAEQAELVAAVDVNEHSATTYAEEFGIGSTYSDLHEALEREKPDLVHICTPPSLHAEQSVAALNAGAWVLCEKPLCASLAELDRIEDAERRSGKYCASVFQWRFGSGMRHVKRQIDDGVLGKPTVAVCNTLWYRDHDYYAVPWRGRWDTELGGPTMGHGIHIMDSFLWLMGPWSEVTAKIGTLDREIEVEDVSMAIVRFESGAMATVVNSVLSPRQETYLRLDFQKATIEATGLYSVGNADWRWTAVPGVIDLGAAGSRSGASTAATSREAGTSVERSAEERARDVEAEWSAIGPEIPASHTEQIRALLADMTENRRPLTSGDQARRTLDFLTAIYKSAFTDRTVRAQEIVPGDPFYGSLNGGA